MAEEAVADGTSKDPRTDGGAGAGSATGVASVKTLTCLVLLPALLAGLAAGGYGLGLFAAPSVPAPVALAAGGIMRAEKIASCPRTSRGIWLPPGLSEATCGSSIMPASSDSECSRRTTTIRILSGSRACRLGCTSSTR